MSFSAVGLCGGGLMQCFSIATSAQSGVTPGVIIAGSDTQGTYYSSDQGTHWSIRNNGLYPLGHSKAHQIAGIAWSAHETGPTGISAIYALTGDAGNAGVTSGGGLMVSLDGSQTWALRSTAVMGGGNHAGGDVVIAQNWPRPAGRLIAEDASFLYVASYGAGVKRSSDHGATFPVTFKMNGTTPATGAFISYGMFLDPAGTLWLVTYPSTTSNGGLWKCTTPQATAPNFTPVTLPAGITQGNGPMTIDVLALDTGSNLTVYLACGNQGLWSNAGGSWGNLSGNGTGGGGGLDTTAGNSFWNTVDGYVDGSGNHVILTACSNAPSHECAVKVTVAAHGTGAKTWAPLTSNTNVTVDPVPGHGFDPFTTTVGTPLGKAGFVNPCIRFDPTDATHQTIFCSGSNGMYVTADGGSTWQMANNGFAAFLGHSVAADPNHAGYMMFGDSDWHCWQVSDGIGVGGATSDSQATIQRVDPGNQAFCFAYDPVDSTVYCGTGPKYGSPNSNGNVKSKTYNAWSWGASLLPATPPFTKIPMGMCAFRNAANQKCLLAAVAADDIYLYNAATSTWTDVLAGFGGTTLAPGLHYPMAYAGAGVVYAWNRTDSLWRSTNYGAAGSWTRIWSKASSNLNQSQIAVNPFHPGELWVSASTGLYKLTGADTGSSVGSGITLSGPFTGTGGEVADNSAIAFDAAGNLYCAVLDGGGGTGVFKCAGNSTTSPDGVTWADVVGDGSFARCNGNPENMAIGPDNRIFVAGSNAVATGLAASSGGITEVQAGNNLSSTGGGALALWFSQPGGAPSTAGTTLIARIELNSGADTVTAPAGWVLDADASSGTGTSGVARVQVWRLANNAGGLYGTAATAATFTQSSGSAILKGLICEYAAPAGQVVYPDQAGTAAGTSPVLSMPVSATAADRFSGGLAVAMFGAAFSAAPSEHWNTPAGWTADGVVNNLTNIWVAYYQTSLPAGTTSLTGSVSSDTGMTGWAAAVTTYYAAAPQPLTIATTPGGTPTTLPAATVGTAYNAALAGSGGVQPYTWAATGLPAGLALNTATGAITGTSAGAGTFTVHLTLTDGAGNTARATLTLAVAGSGPVLPPSAPQLLGYASGAAVTTLTIPLAQPTGPGDNVLVGVAVSTAGVTATVTDSQGNAYTAVVSDTANTGTRLFTFEAASAAQLATTATITVTLSAAGPAVAIAASNPVPAAAFDAAVAAHGTGTSATAATSAFTPPVEQNALVFLADTAAGGAPVWGTGWAGLTAAGDGGGHLYLSLAARQVSVAAGGGATVVAGAATIASAPWAMAVICEQIDLPAVSSGAPSGIAGVPYSLLLTATGGQAPYTWSVSGLPPGLVLTVTYDPLTDEGGLVFITSEDGNQLL